MSDLTKTLIEQEQQRETKTRQGKVVSIQAGPPRTVTVLIDGTNYAGIRVADHVEPVVNEGVWIADMGKGRWLIFATNSSAQNSVRYSRISFGTAGVAAPTFTSYSAGVKLVIYDNVDATHSGYTIGIEASYMYFTADQATTGFKWYAGTTLRAQIETDGTLYTPMEMRAPGYRMTASATTDRLYYAAQPSSGPWCTGPLLRGSDGWSFFNELRAEYSMGFRGATAAADNYLWIVRRLLVGSGPNDAANVEGINLVTGGVYAHGINLTLRSNQAYVYNPYNIFRCDRQTTTGWSNAAMLIYPNSGSGGPGPANIGLNAYGSACVIRVHSTNGARVEILNSDESAYAVIAASAFTVASSLRFKEQIAEVDDADLLGRIGAVKTHTYKNIARPQTIRPTARFAEINGRWTAKGHTPLTLDPAHTEVHEHDCAIDGCAGTAESPCRITMSDTMRMGLIAEHVHAVLPEATTVDDDGVAETLDVDQIAAMAFGGVGALFRRIQALEAQVAALSA